MCVYQFDESHYRMHTEIIACYPWLKKGCRTRSDFLAKHGIPDASCLYARMDRVQWKITSGTSRRFDKLFIEATIVEQLLRTTPVERPLRRATRSISKGCSCNKKTAAWIYLFAIGSADQLRDSMAIDPKYHPGSLVCKFGRTNDLARRTKEHAKQYGSIPGARFRLIYHIIVNAQDASTAEKSISHLIKKTDCSLSYLTTKELAIMTEDQLLATLRHYDMLARRYPERTDLFAKIWRKARSAVCQKCDAGIALSLIARYVIACLIIVWYMRILF